MLAEAIRFIYKSEISEIFRGTQIGLNNKLYKGYVLESASNGRYNVLKPAIAEIMAVVHDDIYEFDVQELIKKRYGVETVTESIFERFKNEVKEGVICLDYEEESGLTIK